MLRTNDSRRPLRRRVVGVVVAVAATITIAGCANIPEAGGETFTAILPPWQQSAPVNPYAANAVALEGWVSSPLAFWLQKDDDFEPQIAKSWDVQRPTDVAADVVLTITIDDEANWPDGSPITSADVETSLELDALFGSTAGTHIKSIETPSEKQIVVTQTSEPFHLFERAVLTTYVQSAKEWKQHLPDDAIGLVAAAAAGDETASTKSADAVAKISAVDARGDYQGSGPYSFSKITASEILLSKNDEWVNAAKVVPTSVKIVGASSTQAFGLLQSGKMDYVSTYAPPAVVDSYLKRDGSHLVAPDGNYGPALYFNTSVAPFDDVRVRQALAYTIDRKATVAAAYPLDSSSIEAAEAAAAPHALSPAIDAAWLSDDTRAQLNPYDLDLKKAEGLLTEAGMVKESGKWMFDGAPFKVEIATPAGATDWVATSEAVANQLSQAGIDASVSSIETNTFFANANTGLYPVSLNQAGSVNQDPWSSLSSTMSTIGLSGASETTYNWGPELQLADGRTVNVTDSWQTLATTFDEATITDNVNSIALAFNQTLPVIDLFYNKFYAAFYSTSRWEGWPDESSPLWDPNIIADSGMAPLMVTVAGLKPSS
ncbi:ABC transporter substrate-binding protein [Microbacterium sp. BWT-B31]|uniref:ABC transporter substrate-binding protein n=1 Tax=Microbacterium sp. BWT-B31 TaxID=3232072 RepID=UPI00352832E7